MDNAPMPGKWIALKSHDPIAKSQSSCIECRANDGRSTIIYMENFSEAIMIASALNKAIAIPSIGGSYAISDTIFKPELLTENPSLDPL